MAGTVDDLSRQRRSARGARPGNGDRHVAKPVSFTVERHDPNSVYEEPTLAISPQSARSLMQALWDAGIRPEDANLSSPAEVTALKHHIKFAGGVTGALLERTPATRS